MTALLRILAWTLAMALIALPVVAVVNGWIGAERWPLRTLRINDDLQRVEQPRELCVVRHRRPPTLRPVRPRRRARRSIWLPGGAR